MKSALRKTLKISGLILGAIVLLALLAAFLVLFDKPLVRNFIQSRLNKGAGTTARIGRLDYSLFPFRVDIEELELGQEDAFQKIGVSLPRLRATGGFWKIVRGTKPAFETIEAGGLSFRLEQKAVSEEPLDVEKILVQVSDLLAWTKKASLGAARLSLAFLGGRADVENFDLTLTPGPEKDVVGYSIGRGDVTIKAKDGSAVLSMTLGSSGRLGLVSPYVIETSFTLDSLRFTVAGAAHSLERLALSINGRFDKSAQELDLSSVRLAVPGLVDLQGRASGKLGHGVFVEAQAGARFESLSAAASLLGPLLPAPLRTADLRGRAELSGKYLVQRSDRESKDNLAATLALQDVELAAAVAGRAVRVRAAGRVEAAGPSNDPALSADIRASIGPVAVGGLAVSGADVRLVGSGTKSNASVSLLDARLGRPAYDAGPGRRIASDSAALTAKGTYDLVLGAAVLTSLEARLDRPVYDAGPGRRIALENTILTAQGNYDTVRGAGALTSLEARLPGFPPLHVSGRYGSGPKASSELRIEGRGLEIASVRALAAPFIPAGLSGWDLGGAFDLALSARRPTGTAGDWGFSGTVSFVNVKFNDPSFTIAGDGLDPVFTFEGAGTASKGLSFQGGLAIGRGESLWKSVYVAWAKHPLKLDAAGRYDPGSGALSGLEARILMPEVGSIDVAGTAALAPAPSFDLTAGARLNLGPLYSLYTQAGVSEASRLKLEGSLEADLGARKTAEDLSLSGLIKLADVNLERPLSKTLIIGVSAELPIRYESAAVADAPLAEKGRLHIGEFQHPFLTLKPIDVSLRSGANALAVEPLALDLFGGRLELGETVFRLDPKSGSFQGVGSLALRDVDVAKFPIASPQFRLTGRIQAEFPRLDIGTDKIAVSGRGEASVFGGKIVLRDLAVSKPFDPGRSISLNVDLVDLDMKKLTDEVPFGEVTGVVRGEIRDLVLSYGQPESFVFRLESVPTRGVAQTFSLKAVDNLTVLSSGQQASGGTGSFWMKFIRGFRYQKLGIVSTLHNDTFTLNGTIREGGVEYLVKKPALFGISVVNREPDKKISFKEMTSRLKRVGQSEK